MMQTSVQSVPSFYPAPPINRAARETVQILCAETKSRIYDRLLDLLSNPQIRVRENNFALPYILHPLTKAALASEHGFTAAEINDQEKQIIKDAEHFRNYEITRDVPMALYHALEKTGDSEEIFANRIVALPGSILNALICAELQREFPRRILLACDGFVEVRERDARGVIYKSIRLDIGGWLVRAGFMLPMYKNGLITALQIFRHPQDRRPFRLKSRTQGGNNGDEQ